MSEVIGQADVQMFKHVLQLCGIGAGDSVAIVSRGPGSPNDYSSLFMAASRELKADAYLVVPEFGGSVSLETGVGVTPLTGNSAAIAALKTATLIIDQVFMLFSPEQIELQQAGVRILLCVEPLDVLRRLVPTEELRTRVEFSEALLRKAGTLRVTSEAGTDVTYGLGHYDALTEYGYTDIPGRWDHWPSGFLATCADDGAVEGRVVLSPGDIIFPFKRYVHDPVTITIAEGRMVGFEGGVDAKLLSEFVEQFDDERGLAISHIGWGLNDKARWSALATDRKSIGMEGRAFWGNVLFSTGPNTEFGGDNSTLCHLDIPLRDCSLSLDGDEILRQGSFLLDELHPRR